MESDLTHQYTLTPTPKKKLKNGHVMLTNLIATAQATRPNHSINKTRLCYWHTNTLRIQSKTRNIQRGIGSTLRREGFENNCKTNQATDTAAITVSYTLGYKKKVLSDTNYYVQICGILQDQLLCSVLPQGQLYQQPQ